MSNDGNNRASPCRLTTRQKYEVATWLVENGYVTQDKNTESTDFTYWRIKRETAKKELPEAKIAGVPEISMANLSTSLNFFNEVNNVTRRKIDVPTIQDTVREDMLVAQLKQLEKVIIEKEKQIKDLSMITFDDSHRQILHQIAMLIPASVYSKKK